MITTPLEKDAKALSAATSGDATPNNMRIDRPTTMAEWTLFICGVLTIFLAAFFGLLIAFGQWPTDTGVSLERIRWLGLAVVTSAAGALLLIVAVASPTVGHISAKVGPDGISGSVDGPGSKS